jgi:hypothetical protein
MIVGPDMSNAPLASKRDHSQQRANRNHSLFLGAFSTHPIMRRLDVYVAMTHGPEMLTHAMTAEEFNGLLAGLNGSVYGASKLFGISLRQAQRYSAAEQEIPARMAAHLRMIAIHVRENQEARRRLLKQITDLESGRFRLYSNKIEITKNEARRYREILADLEKLLTEHPTGFHPGFG